MASLIQFSLRSLLAAVTILALGVAALLNPSVWWEAAIWGVAMFFLATAILLVIYRRSETRAFWVGFVVFGGLFLSILLYSYAASFWDEHGVPTRIAHAIYQTVLPESRTAAQIPNKTAWEVSTVGGYVYYGAQDGSIVRAAISPGSGSPTGAAGTPLAVLSPVLPMIPNPNQIPLRSFTSIMQALWLMVVAAAGGKVCQFVYRTRPKEAQP
jgi:hypothetical protein